MQRNYRIDVESDSTVRGDLTRNQQRMSEFLNATAQFASSMGPIIQQMPAATPAVVEIYASFSRNFRLGKQAEDALSTLSELAKSTAKQGQPPDPKAEAEQAKLQFEQEKAQQAMALEQEKFKFEQQKQAAQFEMDKAKSENDAALARAKAEADVELQRQMAAADVEMQREKHAADVAFQRDKHMTDVAIARDKQSSDERVMLEKVKSARVIGLSRKDGPAPDDASVEDAGVEDAIASMFQQQLALNSQSVQATQSLSQQLAQLAEHLNAPSEIVRGPDGRAVGVRKGGREMKLVRGPDGRAVGLH
jgi:hypothetical protein